MIGMPTYGRSFTLADRSKYVVNSPTTGGGTAGEFTREAGFLGEALLSDVNARHSEFSRVNRFYFVAQCLQTYK